MIRTVRNDGRPAPIWAALGAPLVGIPLLVALVSLASPDATPAVPEVESVAESVVSVEPASSISQQQVVGCEGEAPVPDVRES